MDNEKENPIPDTDQQETPTETTGEILDFTEASADTAEEIIDLTEESSTETPPTVTYDTAAEPAAEIAEENAPEPLTQTDETIISEAVSESRDTTGIIGKIMLWVISVFLFIGASSAVVYYIMFASRGEFHADCTDTIMWANASVESGKLYDPNFTYACFLPFSTSTLIIPLIKIFGFGMTAHSVGMLCYFILLAVFMALMLKEINDSFPAGFIGTALFLSVTLITQKLREIFWGHTIYYSLGILFLVIGAYLYARTLTLKSKELQLKKGGKNPKKAAVHRVLVFLCLCVFMLLTGMDGITGLTLFALPFAGAVFIEQFINKKYSVFSGKTMAVICRSLIFLIMAVAGNLINNRLLGGLEARYQDANSEFSEMNTWLAHAQKLPFAWMRLLGVESLPDIMFTAKQGVPNLIFIVFALILAAMPIIATLCYKKYGNDRKGRMMRIWVWIHWAVTAVVLMGYICGVLAVADWRLVPVIGTSLILSISFVCWAVTENADCSRIASLLILPVFAAGYLGFSNVRKMPKDGYKDNIQYKLADFLEDEGATRGYATFWNANSVTLITGGKIKVSDVLLDEEGVSHRKYQSSSKWYEDDPLQREYFLLLNGDEYNTFISSDDYINDPPLHTINKEIDDEVFILLIYDHNIV